MSSTIVTEALPQGGEPSGKTFLNQKLFQFKDAVHFQDGIPAKIGHDDNRKYNFIGGKAKNKCKKDNTIHAKQLAKWIKKIRATG